jgi:sortase A
MPTHAASSIGEDLSAGPMPHIAGGRAASAGPAESSPIGAAAPLPQTRRRADALQASASLRRLAWLVLAAAAVMLVDGGYIVAKAALGQALLERAWRASRATGVAVKPWPWADMHPVARLIAPAQHADVIVLAGATGRTLAWGPGQLDGSARPGDAGNTVFTAHRDTHFAFLAHLRRGDLLEVERLDGARVRFRVDATAIVDVAALELRARTDAPTLTLVTCYPFDAIAPNTPLRFVVSATRTSPSAGVAGA